MREKTRWNSRPLDEWSAKYANGKFIDLNGHATHYLEKGDGPPVILLHGWFHDSQMWNKNIDALAQRFRVYAIDLWGYGYSTREALDWDYDLYAKQLRAFMEALHIQRAYLVGHSMGAGVCILFSNQYREMVSQLILVSPAGLPNPSPLLDEATLQKPLKELVLNGEKSRRLLLDTMFIYNPDSISDDFFNELTRFHEIKGTNEVLIGSLKRNFFDGLSKEIKEIGQMNVPVLIIWGRHDKSVSPELGIKMHEVLRNSRLEFFEDSAHCANYEQPERFNETVMRFLDE